MAALKVTANSRKILPTRPPIIRIGMNTAISDVLIESTVNPISLAPRNAAATGVIPCSRYRVMFSSTTMASSTTNPVEIASAMSERLSRLYPQAYMTAKVPISERGTAMLGMIVALTVLRNAKTTRMTSTTEIRRVISMSRTEARIVVVRSITTSTLIAGDMDALNCGNKAYTLSTV